MTQIWQRHIRPEPLYEAMLSILSLSIAFGARQMNHIVEVMLTLRFIAPTLLVTEASHHRKYCEGIWYVRVKPPVYAAAPREAASLALTATAL